MTGKSWRKKILNISIFKTKFQLTGLKLTQTRQIVTVNLLRIKNFLALLYFAELCG